MRKELSPFTVYDLGLSNLIARNVALSVATEPLAEKPGLTTRSKDSSLNARLNYFIVGGLNVQWAFRELAENMLTNRRQPNSIFKYAYRAQIASAFNRKGSKVTFGTTLLLIPLVAAHLRSVIDGNQFSEIGKIPAYISLTIDATTENDVADLDLFCTLALNQSRRSNAEIGAQRDFPNPSFQGKYANFREAIKEPDFAKLIIAQEIIAEYPHVFGLVKKWRQQKIEDILQFTERVYPELKKKWGRGDIAADLIVPAMYLIFCEYPEKNFYT